MNGPTIYEICVEGEIDEGWSDWFEGLQLTRTGDGGTLISGRLVDQAALRGVLEKIWNLNLVLISIQRLEA
jgi:hypothetical protein